MNQQRKFVFRGGGREVVLPVTPPTFEVTSGRAIQAVNIHELGDVNLPGNAKLANIKISGFFPAQAYPFAWHFTDPYSLVAVFATWSAAGEVVRFLIPGTAVNLPVLIEDITYGEQDGSNDVYYTLSLSEYRYLEVSIPEDGTPTASRAVDSPPMTASSYTVVKGDTLASIARKFYGDSGLAYKLATANGIKNPNLIKVGQVLTIPDAAALAAYKAAHAPKAGEEPRGGGGSRYTRAIEAER